ISDPGLVDAYAIGVAKCPTGYVGGCLTGTVKTEQKSFTSSSSYDSSAAFVPSGFALTGGGGYSWLESEDDGPGRLLVKLIPDVSGDFVAWDKDHVDATTTGMAAQAIGIAKMPTIPVPSGYNNYCS